MAYKDLYSFFSSQCKIKGIRVEQLIEYCNCSRSTMYRYMKGISPIPVKVKALICKALELDDSEIHDMNVLIKQAGFDESLLKSREALDDFMFNRLQDSTETHGDVPLVYYDNEKYFRTFDEALDEVLESCSAPGASCTIKIVNSVHQEFLNGIARFLGKVYEKSLISSVEHMLSFGEHDYLGNIRSLISLVTILPLANYKGYKVFYSTDGNVHYKGLFSDTVMIDVAVEGSENLLYWFSLSSEGLSSCIRFSDKYMRLFLLENVNKQKSYYEYMLLDSKGIDVFSSDLLDFMSKGDNYLLKPNNCYDKMPVSVYESLVGRCTEEVAACFSSLSDIDVPAPVVLAHYVDYITARINLTQKISHTDIYSKKGLTELAQTGRITDHFDSLPSFSKEETRTMLEYVRDRNNDPNDAYTLYITEQDLLSNGFVISVVKGAGIMIELGQEYLRQGLFNNILIQNNGLVDIFTDYIENHLVYHHTLPQEEATAFIDGLIRTYLTG